MKKLKNILLIEDDEITNYINRRLIKRLRNSLQINIAQNGQEGLKYIKDTIKKGEEIPELILLDINMPVMDGFEFIQEFKKLMLKEKIVIVMLSTSSHIKDMIKLFESGNSDIIDKPLTEQKFLSILGKYFDHKDYSPTI